MSDRSSYSVGGITYTLVRCRRRSLCVTVRHTGEVCVSAPSFVPLILIKRFVSKRADRIHMIQARLSKHPMNVYSILLGRKDHHEFKALKQKALVILTERIRNFNTIYGFKYGRISIRDQHSRWGSCSAKGNINLNYKLILLPDELRDYVVVHELCHLRELNHSRRFWELVALAVPEHKKMQKKLRGLD